MWLQEWQPPRIYFENCSSLSDHSRGYSETHLLSQQWPGEVTSLSHNRVWNSLWPPVVTFSGCSERTPLWRYFPSGAKSDFCETQLEAMFGLLPINSTVRKTCSFSQVKNPEKPNLWTCVLQVETRQRRESHQNTSVYSLQIYCTNPLWLHLEHQRWIFSCGSVSFGFSIMFK